ncbi:MAG: trypsin-like serine protease [Myxococcales bacterium]|nr:trypsin-like serine protease [Myxococcales bacterium]
MLLTDSARTISSIAALLVAAAASVGCQDGSELGDVEVEQQTQAIVNGDLSMNDDQVVALVYNNKQFCTGTVVSKRTVVTAAHCLPPHVNVPLFGIEVFFGSDVASGNGTKLRVVDGLTNPSWNVDVVAGDVGILAISDDAPVEPMPMAYLDVSVTGMVGADARAVGFGVTEADGDGNGLRRTGMLIVDRYDASSLFLNPGPSATCNGDSGGALIFMQDGVEVLGGIHSRSDCGSSIIAERVDVHTMDFIMPFIEQHEGAASCEADGMCASDCEDPDPDCVCAADGICSDACAHPSADLDCLSECPTDGVCDETCSYDYDCVQEAVALCPDDAEGCGSTEGSCSSTGSGSSTWFALSVMLLFVSRRRRQS